MPTKKKKKSKVKKYLKDWDTSIAEMKSERSGAYQTHEGGPILNSRDSWMRDPFSKTADKVSRSLRGKKLPVSRKKK